eukprot:8833864-Karenia_brevis.AAC.1
MTLEQIERLDGEIHREVQMTLPYGSVPVLSECADLRGFDLNAEVLQMLRGGFGLKDSPRSWQKVLQSVLERIGARNLVAEAKL